MALFLPGTRALRIRYKKPDSVYDMNKILNSLAFSSLIGVMGGDMAQFSICLHRSLNILWHEIIHNVVFMWCCAKMTYVLLIEVSSLVLS